MDLAGFTITVTAFEQLQSGDEQAFESVYHAYHPLIFANVNRLCNDTELSIEIVQETFVQLFLHKGKLGEPEALYPFLYTVSKRLAISAFRRSVVRIKYEQYLKHTFKEESQESESLIFKNDLSIKLQELINELPDQQRKVFKMNKLDDMSYKEIADLMGVSPHTVRNQIASATRIIRLKVDKLLFLLLFLKFFQ
ncbi:RNA polymerase sigma factor [Sphingobacterium suaedae]|uniref:RNA polymerase sigma factor n=1 Tax=Sphingobacterium suaedae TaxID=1686402 RepID=A0ABW5KMJ8_9SPHI